MASDSELRDRALQLYAQGAEHIEEANKIVREIAFELDDLDVWLAGLIHGAWDDDEEHFLEAVERAWYFLSGENYHLSEELMDFVVVDRLRMMEEPAAALKVLERLDVADDRRVMWLRRKAELLYGLGQGVKGMETAWEAIELDPSDSISHRIYGLMLFHSRDRVPAIMSLAYAIGLEHVTSMVEPMLGEMIRCLNIETMSVGGSTLTLGSLGGLLNAEYLFFEMSITIIKQQHGDGGRATLHRELVGEVIDSICRYSSASMDCPQEEIDAHTAPYKFYVPFFSSLKRAEVVDEFTDHLYRTTDVSDAQVYDFEDRFRIKSHAKGGPLLPESPGWRERDRDPEEDEPLQQEPAPSTAFQRWTTAAERDELKVPVEHKEASNSSYLPVVIALLITTAIFVKFCT